MSSNAHPMSFPVNASGLPTSFLFGTALQTAIQEGAAILIDKEKTWTSFDVVAKLRGILRMKKIGHAGTLDPLATGLLIVCTGKSTKSIETFQSQRKSYHAVIRIGATTPTDDAEMPEEHMCNVQHIKQEDIQKVVESFVGTIEQIPPMFSAIKTKGVPLYKLARKGKTVERVPRTVTIYALEIVSFVSPLLTLTIQCSKGTYIRSLARDIGECLGCGAYLYDLRRTAIGEYSVADALTIQEVAHLIHLPMEFVRASL
jgi:tRNA pseudouridine55 synthase